MNFKNNSLKIKKMPVFLGILLLVLLIFGLPFERQDSLKAEIENLKSLDNQIRFSAISKFVSLGPEGIPYILKYIDLEDTTLKTSIIQVLGEIRSPLGFNTIQDHLYHKDWRIQFFSAEALGKLNIDDAIPDLEYLIVHNDDKRVILRALLSLAEINGFKDLKFLKGLKKKNRYEKIFHTEVNSLIRKIERQKLVRNN